MTPALLWTRDRIRPLIGEKLAITTVLTIFFAVGWFSIPRLALTTPRTLRLTELERAWPFVEGWIWIYLSIGLFNIAAPYITTDRALLHRHAWGFTIITVASFV